MSASNVEIKLGPRGSEEPNRVVVDGQDVTQGVTAVTIRAGMRLPEVELNLAAVVLNVEGQARIKLAPDAEKALLALGWAPPATDPDRQVSAVQIGYYGRCDRCGELADHSSRGTVDEALDDADQCPCRDEDVPETAP